MLVKDIQKPDNFDKFLSTKNYWLNMHRRNAKTPINNIGNPTLLGDKMTWCCCNFKYNKQLFDKATAKEEVIKILNTDKYIIPTYQICNNINEINWKSLIGKSFVIKPNNQACANGVIIQKNKMHLKDIAGLKEVLSNNIWLNKKANKIIIEKFIGNKHSTRGLFQIDYKFWCFNGKPFCCELQQNGKGKEHCSAFRDLNFKKINIWKDYYNHMDYNIRKPKNFDKMVEIAEKLSHGMPVVRIDLYNVNGKIYFGEFQKIYGYHCRFENIKQNNILSYLLNIHNMTIADTGNSAYLYYETKISEHTNEAKQILGCNDENFEFIWSKNKFPIYFNNKNKNIGIFNINDTWFCNDYIDNFIVKPNTTKKIYNKRTKTFESFDINEAQQKLDTYNNISYCYDDQGDIVYFNIMDPDICVKKVNGQWQKNRYKTIKIQQQQL